MPSAEYAKRLLQGLKYGYISFDKGDRTGQAARIGGWTVDDWTRVRTVHLKQHLTMVTWCLMSL